MTDYKDKLNEIFDLEIPKEENIPVVKSDQNVNPVIPDASLEVDLMSDYEKARKNYDEIISKGLDAIDEISDVARESQEPRAYEVLGQLIKSVTDTNEKKIMLQKQMRDMTRTEKTGNNTNIDKAIFIGSAADLNKLLKGKQDV